MSHFSLILSSESGVKGCEADLLLLRAAILESSMWSKDIIFLISDGYSDGSQAWLDSYHGYDQSSTSRSSTESRMLN